MQVRCKQGWCGVVFITIGLSACATSPTPQASHYTAQGFAAETQAVSSGNVGGHPKSNVPSAPLNTPLCGSALHEQAQAGAALYTQGLTSGNACAQNSCFQPLTGTYITQGGANTVCR